MKTMLLSFILVVFSAVSGTVIVLSWVDVIESIEDNMFENYIVVPEVNTNVITDEIIREQLIVEIQKRLALVLVENEDTATSTLPTIEIIPKRSEKKAGNVDTDEISVVTTVHQSVPFTSQAPYGDWSEPWQDACEEASVIMAHAYFAQKQLSATYVYNEVYKLIEYEEEALGYYDDTNIADTALMARAQYGLITRIIDNATVVSIQQELNNGNLVIAPMAGRLLANPYFTPPGPLYHMLVIIGYDDTTKQFITNDPGTRNGSSLRYPYENVMNALHDWTGDKNTVQIGAKRVLIVEGIS